MLAQRGKVREVGDMRQADHSYIQDAATYGLLQTGGKAVLIVNVRTHPGHHAQHRDARQLLQLPQAGAQQLHIAAKFVDDRALHAPPLFLPEQSNGAVELGEYAAAVDVSRQQYRGVDYFRKAHVHDVIRPEVDLRGGAGPLDDDDVIFGGKAVVSRQDVRDEAALHFEILRRRVMPAHFPVYDELAARVAGGL